MPAAPSVPLTLNEDVLIVPVSDLADDVRARAEGRAGEFAVSRMHGRSGSSIVDADAARLLDRFREPRTVVEAVILFSRERGLDAAEVLDGAYPLLRSMVERRVLVPAAEQDGAGAAASADGEWAAGRRLEPGTVVRTLQLLDDAAVHLLVGDAGGHAVLKSVRASTPVGTAAATARLAHEAAYLAHLDATGLVPRLVARGETEARAWLLIEHVAGADADAAAAEARDAAPDDDGRALLALLRAVAAAYARLHAHGVLHGDVHPRNALVERDGGVRLLDFGLASPLPGAAAELPPTAERGGIPFYFEPELAAAYLARTAPPPPSEAGEQFGVAAMLYTLATGQPWRDFRLGRDEMLHDVADGRPLPFADRGVRPWPALEQVLARALATDARDRFASLAALAAALDAVTPPPAARPAPRTAAGAPASPAAWAARVVASVRAEDAMHRGVGVAPTASLTYGAAGIALGLLHVAARRPDPALLADADRWLARAEREIGRPDAFHNAEIQIVPDLVGESSPYHAPSGVHLVDALLARAAADPLRQLIATHRYVEAAALPAAGLDLTCGRASTLLGAAILFDAAPSDPDFDASPIVDAGDAALGDLWRALDALRPVADGDVEYPGIAHGWAGFLYATLQWCRVSGAPLPDGVARRLDELARLAIPAGRGLEWPWVLRADGEAPTMPGWCNGSCGHELLWSLAARTLDADAARWEALAVGAGWSSWESAEPAATLCCGLAGRAYALLDLHRLTGDARWLDRARRLAARATRESATHREYPHSLYKGDFGVAVLVADLDDPTAATMPGFEPLGYRDPAAARSRASSAAASVTGSSQT